MHMKLCLTITLQSAIAEYCSTLQISSVVKLLPGDLSWKSSDTTITMLLIDENICTDLILT